VEGELQNEYAESGKMEELKLTNPQKPNLNKGVYQSKKLGGNSPIESAKKAQSPRKYFEVIDNVKIDLWMQLIK